MAKLFCAALLAFQPAYIFICPSLSIDSFFYDHKTGAPMPAMPQVPGYPQGMPGGPPPAQVYTSIYHQCLSSFLRLPLFFKNKFSKVFSILLYL